jgi:hypothetical protein
LLRAEKPEYQIRRFTEMVRSTAALVGYDSLRSQIMFNNQKQYAAVYFYLFILYLFIIFQWGLLR